MDNNQPVTVVAPATPPVETQPQPVTPPAKKNNKMLLIILSVLLIVVLVSVFIFLAMSKKNPSKILPTPSPIPTIPATTTPPAASPTSSNPIIELSLTKGVPVAIPNSDVVVVYRGQSASNPKCVDCSTTTDVALVKGKIEQKLSYICGGIAGTCTENLSAYGFNVILEKTTDTTASVKIQKQ
jgi:hypothetical protein